MNLSRLPQTSANDDRRDDREAGWIVLHVDYVSINVRTLVHVIPAGGDTPHTTEMLEHDNYHDVMSRCDCGATVEHGEEGRAMVSHNRRRLKRDLNLVS